MPWPCAIYSAGGNCAVLWADDGRELLERVLSGYQLTYKLHAAPAAATVTAIFAASAMLVHPTRLSQGALERKWDPGKEGERVGYEFSRWEGRCKGKGYGVHLKKRMRKHLFCGG